VKIRFSSRNVKVSAALVGLLIVSVFVLVIVREQQNASVASAGSGSLTGLAVLNVLLMVVLFFVLFRELVKGFLAWRRQREGARFRTRLLTTFVLLGLVPSLLLFIGAIILIQSTVDRWFRSPVNSLTIASQNLVDKSMDLLRTESRRKVHALAWQLKQVPVEMRPSLLKHLNEGGDIDVYYLVNRKGKILARTPDSTSKPDAYKVSKLFRPGGLVGWMDLAPKPTVLSGTSLDAETGLIVGIYIPEDLFDKARFISANYEAYLQIRNREHILKISMISSFLALTLLITFASVWLGSHLLREINQPLQLLLEGTREVSRGNLEHRIAYEARDEFGLVVDSFNGMTSEVEMSRAELENRNRELRSATDFSERRRRYIETLVETLNIGVISMTANGQVHTLNSKARTLLGLHPDEAKKHLVSRPEWAPIAALLAAKSENSIINREVTLTTSRGYATVSVTSRPLNDPTGEVSGFLVILEDISDLVRAQRSAAWQEAARRMAHEIKNPLTPIRLSAQRIRKKAMDGAPDLESALVEGCTTIEREVRTMLKMVDEFSRFARLPEVRVRPASLSDLIESTIAPYRSTTDFELDLPGDFPLVRIDTEQMGRVLKNLVENSIQAMGKKGLIKIGLKVGDGHALMSIRDTGPGIPEENRSRLFVPYFSTKKRGTGLGLAIVARILQEHGGDIKVDERYLGGAGFIVSLPL